MSDGIEIQDLSAGVEMNRLHGLVVKGEAELRSARVEIVRLGVERDTAITMGSDRAKAIAVERDRAHLRLDTIRGYWLIFQSPDAMLDQRQRAREHLDVLLAATAEER